MNSNFTEVKSKVDEEFASFTTLKNYLTSLSQIIDLLYKKNLTNLISSLDLKSDKTCGERDRKKFRKILCNSWHTEVLMRFPGMLDESMIRYSNHWVPVQLYYSIYLMASSYFYLCPEAFPSKHPDVLRRIANMIERKQLIRPWSFYATGGITKSDARIVGIKTDLPKCSNIGVIVDPREAAAILNMFLRTTRNSQYLSKRDEWLNNKDNRKRNGQKYSKIPSEKSHNIISKMRMTTVFDGLYRLRIRSNYQDADNFYTDKITDGDAREYYDACLNIANHTLCLFESKIINKIGFEEYRKYADGFSKQIKIKDDVEISCLKRLELYSQIFNGNG